VCVIPLFYAHFKPGQPDEPEGGDMGGDEYGGEEDIEEPMDDMPEDAHEEL